MSDLSTSIIGVGIGFVAGMVLRGIFRSQIYPALSARHEAAKATLQQGVSPQRIATLVEFAGLVILPVIGFFAVGRLLGGLTGGN